MAGVLALIMRTQLAVGDNDFVGQDFYNQLFTLHGSVMMFLFAVPLFEAFSIYTTGGASPAPWVTEAMLTTEVAVLNPTDVNAPPR